MYIYEKTPQSKFDNYITNTINELMATLDKVFPNEEGNIDFLKRMTYREGLEIESVNIRVVFLLDKGEWFKETVSFNIYTDSNIDFISISNGIYNSNNKLYKKNDIKGIINYIIEKVNNELKFNKSNNKILNTK